MKYLVIFVLLFTLALPLFAQDATAEATAPVSTGGVTIINNPTDVTAPAEPPSAPEPWLAKYIAGLAALVVVASTFLGTVNKYFESKQKDVSFMTGAELVAGYAPTVAKDAAKGFVKQIIAFGGNLQAFLDEATDGTPYVVKVHPPVTPPDPTHPEA